MARLARQFTALIIALGCIGPSQADSIALDFTDGIGFFSADTDTTAGWSFSVSSAVTVDGLGFFDVEPDGLRTSHDVGLWTSAGDLLTQATITNASDPIASASDSGRWLFEDVAPIELTPGEYVLGATYFSDDEVDHLIAQAITTTISQISFGTARFADGPGLRFPIAEASADDDGYFGPNLRIAQVPEPASLALLGIGLASLGFNRRRPGVNATLHH